jgi:hypothetical protein
MHSATSSVSFLDFAVQKVSEGKGVETLISRAHADGNWKLTPSEIKL